MSPSGAHEGRDQGLVPNLSAPVPVNLRIKFLALGQDIVREKVFARREDPGAAVSQANLHLPLKDEDPLWCGGDMKHAAKTHRALAQLQATTAHEGREPGGLGALVKGNIVGAKSGHTIGIGEEFDAGECIHAVHDNRVKKKPRAFGPRRGAHLESVTSATGIGADHSDLSRSVDGTTRVRRMP